MNKRRFLLPLPTAVIAVVIFGAGQAWAWTKDPDSAVNPANVVTSTLLSPPDATLGALDTSAAGIADTVVGADDGSAYPTDPTSSGTTFWVDNTPGDGDCPQATYLTIQAAVNASGANDTVKVCPGTYAEQVSIIGHAHDGLRLESLTPLAATIQWPTPETLHQLIYINQADAVTIRGFTISGPFPSLACASGAPPIDRHEGILFDQAFNGRIDHNRITMIRDADPNLWGCQQGDAVSIGRRIDAPTPGGSAGSAQVDHNVIDRYQKNGVQAVNSGTSAIVRANTITYVVSETAAIPFRAAPNGIVVFRGAAATVEQDVISGNHWTTPLSTGIILDQSPSSSSEVDHNRVSDNDYGIETDTQIGLDISHNSVLNSTADAITVCGDPGQGCGPAEQIVVRANDVDNNGGSGILLLGADSNLVKADHVAGNGMDGIHLDASSMGNQVLEDHMSTNVPYDCEDNSLGSGTGGTANTWTNDVGATENRPGLCNAT